MGIRDVLPDHLVSAIEDLYETFAHYRLHPHVEGCTHCVSPEDHIRLQSKPLHQLEASDLAKYARKALTTWGDVDDFRHFLPRILELVATSHDWWVEVDTEVVFSKLDYGHWREWPKEEQHAIETYLQSLLMYVLTRPFNTELDTLTTDNIDRFICGVGQAVDDLGPYLHLVGTIDSQPARVRLGHFVDQQIPYLSKGRELFNAFWSNRQEQMEQVIDWLSSVENEVLMRDALDAFQAEGGETLLTSAYCMSVLEWLRSYSGSDST